MTSLEIINLALARLGAQQATSLSDTNKNPRLAVQAYTFARDEVLRYHPWPCLVKRASLEDDTDLAWVTLTAYAVNDYMVTGSKLYICITAGTTGATAPTATTSDVTDGSAHWKYLCTYENLTDYAYQYVIPVDCLRIVEVGDKEQFVKEGRFIFTDSEDATIKYSKLSTDPDEWDTFIQNAIALRIGAMTAEAITTNKSTAQLLQQEYLTVLTSGMAIASGEASEEPEHETRWEEA